MEGDARSRDYGKWRAATLITVHVLFVVHFVHWKLHGRTLAPLELNEVLYTLHQGVVTGGFVLMLIVMLATLVVGRFFCSWGCHILALQDLCAYLLRKARIKPISFRSRVLVWVPMLVMAYMFIWPQVAAAMYGVPEHELRIESAERSVGWTSFTTDDLWRNLPPAEVAIATFFVCGFLIVYLMGSRGFCFNGCPYGALFGMADQVAPGRIRLTGNCTQCGLCTASCTSDILVHLELKKHGMVTNPRCLKDLDCVAVCPEDAVHFGFGTPPLFSKGSFTGTYSARYSTSLAEDLLLISLFLLTVLILRGLYDVVPLLMAVGAAICLSVVGLITIRAVRSGHSSFRGIVLRAGGRFTSKGVGLVTATVMIALFLVHSAFVQVMTARALNSFEQLKTMADRGQRPSAERVHNAVDLHRDLLGMSLVRPIEVQMHLANLLLLAQQPKEARAILLDIITHHPDHVASAYHLAQLAAGERNEAEAVKYLTLASEGHDRPHSNDRMMKADAHYRLALRALNRQLSSQAAIHVDNARLLDPQKNASMRQGIQKVLERQGVTDPAQMAREIDRLGLSADKDLKP